MDLIERIKGSMIGGAVGDALGYAVEFSSEQHIFAKYGQRGITRYELRDGVAVISDDTQMTMYTANGLLLGNADGGNDALLSDIRKAYIEWYLLQSGVAIENPECWVSALPTMRMRRAPGNTCLTALRSENRGERAVNDSKGCGGIMRVAPVALIGAARGYSARDVAWLASEAARITHKHPFGYLPAGIMAYAIFELIKLAAVPSFEWMENMLAEGSEMLKSLYPDDIRYVDAMHQASLKALRLAQGDEPDLACIKQLGEGWVGEEAWYVALYCTMRHLDSFENAMVAAVNHSGDSDSTGAICGNLLGAIVGWDAIPVHYKQNLEIREEILRMSEDLC